MYELRWMNKTKSSFVHKGKSVCVDVSVLFFSMERTTNSDGSESYDENAASMVYSGRLIFFLSVMFWHLPLLTNMFLLSEAPPLCVGQAMEEMRKVL